MRRQTKIAFSSLLKRVQMHKLEDKERLLSHLFLKSAKMRRPTKTAFSSFSKMVQKREEKLTVGTASSLKDSFDAIPCPLAF